MFNSKVPLQPMQAPSNEAVNNGPARTQNGTSVQRLVGSNLIFFVFTPYFVATALQDTHLQLGLVIATGMAAGHLLIGTLLFIANLRRVSRHPP